MIVAHQTGSVADLRLERLEILKYLSKADDTYRATA